MLKEEGHTQTASILMRLGDVVASGDSHPSAERPVDLRRIDS
jgi:hypothetical protein